MNATLWEAAFQLLNFGVLAWILVRFGKKPIQDGLAARRAELSAAVLQGEQRKQEAERLLAETRGQGEATKAEIAAIAGRAEEMGRSLVKEIASSVQQEAERIRLNTREAIALETRLSIKELREETISLAFQETSEKLAGLDDATHARLLSGFARKVEK